MPSELTKYISDRFWSRVSVGDVGECWNWTGGDLDRRGYGRLTLAISNRVYRRFMSHRLSFWITRGCDPGSMCVCHTCDNPTCCNPFHLFCGTHSDNERDKIAKGRRPRMPGFPKVSEDDVREMLRMRSLGAYQKDIAAKFGITTNSVWRILSGRRWKHITCSN